MSSQHRPRRLSRRTSAGLAALAVGLVGASAAGVATTAQAAPELPARTAEQLLIDLQSPTTTTFSGTVSTDADLGLPALPTGDDSAEITGLTDGTHTLRVWSDGPTRSRVALLGDNTETSLIRNGADVWTYRSSEQAATHTTLTEPEGTSARPSEAPTTPAEAADELLAAVEPSTTVTVDGTSRVAGRPAYDLVLTPDAGEQTLVESATISVDAETHLVLQVGVDAVGTEGPAAQIGFTSIDYATPEASLFTFAAPGGTEVTEQPAPDHADRAAAGEKKADEPTVVGDGWDTVVVQEVGTLPEDAEARQLIDALPEVSGSWGSGRLFQSTLGTAVLTDDGRIAAGAVPADVLYAALG